MDGLLLEDAAAGSTATATATETDAAGTRPPADSQPAPAALLAGYFAVLLCCHLLARGFPGTYEIQFCDPLVCPFPALLRAGRVQGPA